jgi:hypothetical protein
MMRLLSIWDVSMLGIANGARFLWLAVLFFHSSSHRWDRVSLGFLSPAVVGDLLAWWSSFPLACVCSFVLFVASWASVGCLVLDVLVFLQFSVN